MKRYGRNLITRSACTLAPLLVVALLLGSCAEDDLLAPIGNNDPEELTEDEFRDIFKRAGTLSGNATSSNTILRSETKDPVATGNGTFQVCTHKRVKAQGVGGGGDGFPMFNPNASVIYPGSLLQGKTLGNATPDPIVVKRGPGKVVIDLINGSVGASDSVAEVTQSNVVQAMNNIISKTTGPVAANFTMSYEDIRKDEQFALALGVDVSTYTNSLKAKFQMRTDKEYSRVLVKLTQSYYTMSYELPTWDQLFAPEVKPSDLEDQVAQGNPGTYISNVTYGRIYYMMVETTSSQRALSTSIEGSFKLLGNKVDADLAADYLGKMASLKVVVFALGGDAASTISTFGVTDLGKLTKLFAASSDIRTGVPLSYVVRNVWGNGIVATQLATQYDQVDCETYSDMAPALAFRFDAAPANLDVETYTLANGESASYLSTWRNDERPIPWHKTFPEDRDRMFAWGKTCFPSLGINKVKNVHAGRVYTTAGPGGNAFVRFNQHRTPGLNATAHPFAPDSNIHVLPWQRFDGTVLEDTEFTIFAVVRSTASLAELERSGGQYFLFTNERGHYYTEGQSMILGFNQRGEIEMGMTLRGPLVRGAPNRTNWAVYAFRFSRTEGWSIYADNVGSKTSSDPANAKKFLPLDGFRGASIGVFQLRHFRNVPGYLENRCHRYEYNGPNVVGMDIALIEAYTVSAADKDIGDRMKALAQRYGIN